MQSQTTFLEYLVNKALSDEKEVIQMLYMYYVEEKSLNEIARKFGISKGRLRGYLCRALEKTLNRGRARVVLKYFYKHLMALQPVVQRLDGSGKKRCSLCGMVLEPDEVSLHLARHHRDYLYKVAQQLIAKVRKEPRC